jgi:hypothetical protein
MVPNVYDIVKTSLKIARKIIFYLPRTLNILELFEIVEKLNGKKDITFFDIKILYSANKAKAVLIIFGNDSAETVFTEDDIIQYLSVHYNVLPDDYKIWILSKISSIIGITKFLKVEYKFRKTYEDSFLSFDSKVLLLLKYFQNEIMTNKETCKLKTVESNYLKDNLPKFDFSSFFGGS